MDSLQIKHKYKDMLQSSSSDNSDEQWQRSYVKVQNRQISRVVTQADSMRSSQVRISSEQIIRLKERVAQCTKIIQRKDGEIKGLKERIAVLQESNKFKQKQKQELQQVINQQNKHIIDQKAQCSYLNTSLFQTCQNLQLQKLDKQLLTRQIDYYKQEIQKTKQQLQQKTLLLQKQKKNTQEVKEQNARLRNDVNRVKELLGQTQKYRKFASKIQYKSYIGKECKEGENWVCTGLVEDVGRVVKKVGIGKGDRKLEEFIVRFLSKSAYRIVQQQTKRIKKRYNQRIKQKQRNHNQSLLCRSLDQRPYKLPHKPHKQNHPPNIILPTRCLTQQTQTCHPKHSLNFAQPKKHLISRLLKQLKQKIQQQLTQKQISKKRIMIILDWCVQAIMENYQMMEYQDGGRDCQHDKSMSVNRTLNTTSLL